MLPSSLQQTDTQCSNPNRLTEASRSTSYPSSAPRAQYFHGQSAFSAGESSSSQHTNDVSNIPCLTNGFTPHISSPHYDQIASNRALNHSMSHGTYFPQYTYGTYSYDATTYANELNLEDDQTHASAPPSVTAYPYQQPQATQPASGYPWNTGNNVSPPTHEAGDEDGAQGPTAYSPTTRRWSVECSPDECIRLGIPHYATQAQRCRLSDHTACDHEPIDSSHSRL